jgi:CRP-like cAMP-binding protein
VHSKIPASRLELLHGLALFAPLSDAELARVDRLVDDIDLEPGHVLTAQGCVGRQAFIIVAGQATVTVSGRRIATVGPGEMVGEMALIAGRPRTATVTAVTPMRVMVLDPASLRTLLAEADVARKLLDAVTGRLRTIESEMAAPTADPKADGFMPTTTGSRSSPGRKEVHAQHRS